MFLIEKDGNITTKTPVVFVNNHCSIATQSWQIALQRIGDEVYVEADFQPRH